MDDTTAQATPQLLTDIQFNVSRKGYDPSEVDAFLERLSAAVTVMQDRLRQSGAEAESAGRRAAEAERESAALRARIAELESGVVFTPVTAETSPEAEAEQAASVLAMARRTADAVVNDARATAATMLTEAEAEAAAIIGDARARADATVGDLDARRQELTADAVALEVFMDEQRAALSAGLSRIQAVLDDPRALRVGAPPEPREPSPIIDEEPVVPSSDFPTMATPVVEADTITEAPEPELPATSTDRIFDLEEVEAAAADEGALFDAKDDEVDEAMRRFFDADFDDDDRFGR